MSPAHNLLVLSDVHLGSDLVHHARPDAPLRTDTSVRRDRELVALLEWYRARPRGGRPWRLVVAGDLIDFAGMCVPIADHEIETEPTDEERMHGLGSTADHTIAKLRRVAEHHAPVFAAFARFVAAGNTLVIVRGNHDVDLHWPAVQETFRQVLESHAPIARDRVEFSDWFYYEEGVVWVEHGHQYDAYCSYEHVLHPVLPSDPRRTWTSIADVLLRFVVRPTRGMTESGHEAKSAIDYFRFGVRLGAGGLIGLGRRFAGAVAAVIGLWREHTSSAASWIRQEHERKMSLLAEARKISLLKLHALAKLQRPPVSKSLIHILAGLMLDRVALGVMTVVGLLWLIIARWTPELGIAVATVTPLVAALAWVVRRARGSVDPSEILREQATRVAALFPAAFIVMGHTHNPEVRPREDGAGTYVNLGAWAEEEAEEEDAPPLPASRTHLVVCVDGDTPTAELLAWVETDGPRRFESPTG